MRGGDFKIMDKIVVTSRRFFMKFPDLSYFEERAKEVDASIVSVQAEDDETLINEVKDASVIVVIGRQVNKRIIDSMKNGKMILAMQVGYDCVDIDIATKKGIVVSNVPVYCTDDVANHAITLLLAVARNIKLLIAETSKAKWDYNVTKPMYNFKDKTLGIIGLGRIGRALVTKARGFGIKIQAYDPYIHDDIFKLLDVERTYELNELLETSDYISIHSPLTPETDRMINKKAINKMEKGSILINTARSRIVDYSALYQAVKNVRIAGAGIDVMDVEPPNKNDPILNCDRIIVTPHIAWYSEESLRNLMEYSMDEIIRVLKGKRPRWILNPEVLYNK